ncbi:MAG TPA: diguanylate cyclase [Pyrinomonadaceae bacterium]|nr:diguanylate cyclase [Pyrinomonadaceae bacterium]
MTTTSRETSHPARQPARQGLPLAQFAGDRAELLPALSPAATLRELISHWWHANQLFIAWTLLVVPLVLELIYGTFLLPFFILTPISILATYLIYRSARSRLQSKTNEVEALSQLHLATAEALATAIDAKDQTTHCHVRRVQIYAAGMGEVFGLSADEIAALKAGALLHDVGKLAVPPHILNKPGPLTHAEFEKMKIHTVVGAQILGRVDFPYPVIPIVRHHHEQWDGRGYPDRLRGEQIPITARIISVVDCFDSIREDRPFRRGMTLDEATALLLRGAGIHFDPAVVEQFIKNLPRFETEIARRGLEHQPITHSSEPPIQLSEVDMTQTRERGSYIAYDQIKKAHREVYALYEIARTFGTSLDVEHTLEILVDKVGHVVPFDTCVVYFYDENKGYATARHVAGKNAQKLAGRCIALGEGVTGFALANRSAVNQLHPSLDFTDINPEAGIKYRSMASLPLFKDDLLLGAISVYSSELEQYTDDHMRLLETVTRLASDALGNAMQHAEAESNALTDQLTSLPNARYVALRFEEEAARARRTDRSFQVMMLDLDEFKNVNDTYGHKVGDKVLREVAQLIQGQLREYDFLARNGGDEFVALVQEVVGAQVEDLCMRIESAVSKFSLPVGKNRSARVGISIGTATFGVHGETLDQLVVAADNEMYRMKSSHRSTRIEDAPMSADLQNSPPF